MWVYMGKKIMAYVTAKKTGFRKKFGYKLKTCAIIK